LPAAREVYTGLRGKCYSLFRDRRSGAMQQMARSFFRSAWRDAKPPRGESASPPLTSAPEPYIRHRPTEPWELQRIEAALLIPPDEADTLKAVCAHITQHSGDPSSRALAGLVRALYQDAGNFNFDSLDCLGPLMRRHAERLISARLWSALTDHEWQQAYAAVASYEFKDNVAKLAAAAKSPPEPALMSDSNVAASSRTSAEIKPAVEAKSAEIRPAVEAKPAEIKPAVEARTIEPKPADVRPAEIKPAFIRSAEAKPAFDAKAAELRSAPEHGTGTETGRRDERRLFPRVPSTVAASSTTAAATAAPAKREGSLLQRLPMPHETFPHADSFNLENIGRHWRVVLWFAMAALGLAVVTYI
jgi:hypothetical protein